MKDDSLISQIGVILGTIIGIAFILYLAYIATKLLGKRISFKNGGGKKIRILDSVSLGQGKSILLVKAGERVFLVGAAENINLISELEGSLSDDEEQEVPSGMDFKTAFKKVLENNFGKNKKKGNEDGGSQSK